jgi:hypothetical protein
MSVFDYAVANPRDIFTMSYLDAPFDVGGKTLRLSAESGVVVRLRKSRHAIINSDFDGPPSIVLPRTSFSLLMPDGTERPHWMQGPEMFLQDGHRVSLIHPAHDSSSWTYIVNHDTGKMLSVWTDGAAYIRKLGLVKGQFGCLSGIIVLIVSMLLWTWSLWVAGVVFFGTLIIRYVVNKLRARKAVELWERKIRPACELVGAELLASTDKIKWASIMVNS